MRVEFASGQLFELHEFELSFAVRVLLQKCSQFRVRVRDAVDVDVHECVGHHAVEQHREPDHAHDAVHELRDLAEHEVGGHLQDGQQAVHRNVLPVQVFLQDAAQLGLLGFVRAIFFALHTLKLEFEPALENADLGLEAFGLVVADPGGEVTSFGAHIVYDLNSVLFLELRFGFSTYLGILEKANRAQFQTHFLMGLEVRSEERVAVLQVFLQTFPYHKSFASDDVVLPHFNNFDKPEFTDKWHV